MRINRFAFTLAEVLITLGIIGIVAQMTIPTLMQSAEKKTEVAQLKKFYSGFSQGIKAYMVSQGCNDLRCTGVFTGGRLDTTWENGIDKAIKDSFNILKSCDSYTTECDKPLWNLDKTSATSSFYYGHSFITADGVEFMVYDTAAGNCDSWNGATDPTSKLIGACATIYVDINGAKKPDTWGRDIYLFALANDGSLYPWQGREIEKLGATNWATDSTACGSVGSTTIAAGTKGSGCSARIMDQAWEMNY